MFLKIRIRNVLLIIFSKCGQGSNPNSLEPFADYIYFDRLNAWLPLLKGISAKKAACELISATIHGYSAKKAKNISGTYRMSDIIDDKLVKKVDSLDPTEDIRHRVYGCALSYKDGFGF